jgi:hypothetical protein
MVYLTGEVKVIPIGKQKFPITGWGTKNEDRGGKA